MLILNSNSDIPGAFRDRTVWAGTIQFKDFGLGR